MEKTVDLTEILNYLIRKENIRPSELARLSGVPQPTVHRMVTGTCPRPHKSSLEPIARYFDITIDQLKGLEPIPGVNMHKLDSMTGWATVPLVDWKHLSTWPKAEYDYQLTEQGVKTQKREQAMTYTDAKTSTKAFAAYLNDDNMLPLFPKNSLAVFDPEQEKFDGSYVLIRQEDGTILFRQLIVKEQQHFYTTLEKTPSTRPTALNYDDEIIGVLVQVRIDY
jgi:predicted XRE-type DNA-binding protein